MAAPAPIEEMEELPFGWVVWGNLVHTSVTTFYFLFISCIAIGIDLALHWFVKLQFVQTYELSSIIRWEIEGMAYTLASVDVFLFMRVLLQPIIEFIVELRNEE